MSSSHEHRKAGRAAKKADGLHSRAAEHHSRRDPAAFPPSTLRFVSWDSHLLSSTDWMTVPASAEFECGVSVALNGITVILCALRYSSYWSRYWQHYRTVFGCAAIVNRRFACNGVGLAGCEASSTAVWLRHLASLN